MENRFKKIRELGSKGKRSNPLLLDEFHWENEWVNDNSEPVHEGGGNAITWANVDDAIGATQGLEGRNLPRAAAARAAAAAAPMMRIYARKRPRNTVTLDLEEVDDKEQDQLIESDPTIMDEDEESAPSATGDGQGDGGFQFNADLLD